MAEPAAGIPCWDRLSGGAKDALREIAELFDSGITGNAQIVIVEGGCRDLQVTIGPGGLKKLRRDRA